MINFMYIGKDCKLHIRSAKAVDAGDFMVVGDKLIEVNSIRISCIDGFTMAYIPLPDLDDTELNSLMRMTFNSGSLDATPYDLVWSDDNPDEVKEHLGIINDHVKDSYL